MRSKVAVLMSVIFLVVASLLVSGCTTSTTNQTPGSNVTSSAAAQHVNSTSAGFLEKYLTTYKNDTGDGNWSVTAWEVTWINSTSVRLQDTWLNNTSGVTESWEETVTVFPTSQDATNYLNATNLTAYSLASTEYGSEGAYLTVTGHAPQICKEYAWNEGNPLNISDHKLHQISQRDNVVWISTKKVLGVLDF